MLKLRYFFLSMNVLNGLLAAAVAAVVFFVVIPFLNPGVMSLPPAKKTSLLSGEKAAPPQGSSPADYALIGDQNLFHPERKMPLEKQQEKVIPKPELFLYGTLITNDASYAFIEDKKAPLSTPGRGKRQITLKKGDRLSGYILSEIEANRIVFVKGEEKLVVTLDDREKRRAGEASALMPTASQALPSSPQTVTPTRPGMSLPGSRPLSQPIIPSSPQTASSPGPGIEGPGSRPSSQSFVSPSPQAAQPSQGDPPSFQPGIGGSGTWPPTRSSIEQTQQKIREGRLMRTKQLQGN